jgi:hypothetical protein
MDKISNEDFIALVGQAIDKLEVQGTRSTGRSAVGMPVCRYAGDNNACCIVGHMMPDDETRKAADRMPKAGVRGLTINNFEWITQFTDSQIELLDTLQEIHDGAHDNTFNTSIERMRRELETFKDE